MVQRMNLKRLLRLLRFAAGTLVTVLDATSPFRKLLDIGNESDWRQMYIKLRNYRPPSTFKDLAASHDQRI